MSISIVKVSLFCTEMLTTDVTDRFSGFLYSLSREVKKLKEKQRNDIETTVKTDL